MAEEEGKAIQWPAGADEATDFDFLMVGKDDEPIMKIPKEKLNEVIVINGEGVKAVAGGATSAAPTILRPGPTGANRKMEDVTGWFVNGTSAEPPIAIGTPWEAPAGNKNTNWWDGTAKVWSLGSSVVLPEYDIDSDLDVDSTDIVLDVNGYIKIGATLSNGTNDGNSGRRSVVDLPVSTYIGKNLHIEGVTNGSKNVVYRNASNVVIEADTAVTFPYNNIIPVGATKVSFTIKYATTDTYASMSVKITEAVTIERVVGIKDKSIQAAGLSTGNYTPIPVSAENAVPLGFFQANAVQKSAIGVLDFEFSANVTVVRDKYVNSTGFPTDEAGSVYVEIPYPTVGQHIIYQGMAAVAGVDVASEYLFDRVWLDASGNRTGNTLVNGSSLGNQPFDIFTSNDTLVKLRINIFRPSQEGKFDFKNLKIYNQNTGEVYATFRNLVNKIENREILPAAQYQAEVNSKFTQVNTGLSKLNVVNIGRNSAVRRTTSANTRFDHGHIKRCADGSLIAIHSYFYASPADLSPSNLAVSRSMDNGSTWSLVNVKPFTTVYGDVVAESNPDVIQKANGDYVVFHSVKTASNGDDRALAYVVLSNDGTTWGDTTFVTGFDRTAPGGGGGCIMRTGVIYVPIYKLESGSTSADAVSVGGLLKSADGGNTFTNTGIQLYDTMFITDPQKSVFEPFIYETTSNVLIYGYRTLKGYCRGRKSTDGGITFGDSFNLFKAANSMSNVKRLSFYDSKLNFIYVAVHNKIDGAITSHPIDRRYMHISVSVDGETFYNNGEMIYKYNGSKIAFEPNIYDDQLSNNIYVAWSADTNGIDLYSNSLSKDEILRMIDRLIP